MKRRVWILLLSIVMVLSLVACGNDSDADKVAAYVNKNKAVLLSTMEESFAGSSGLTCTSDIKAVGCGIVIEKGFQIGGENIYVVFKVDNEAKKLLVVTPPTK